VSRVCGGNLKQLRRWCAVALLTGTRLGAQFPATVPASSGIYDRLEAISAHYPTRGVFLGERPLSLRQLENIVDRLRRTIDSAPPSARREWARGELLDLVVPALHPSRGVHQLRGRTMALTAWEGEFSRNDARAERIPPNGLGFIDAVTNPFEARRDGVPTLSGEITSFAPTGAVTIGDRFAFAIQPRLSVMDPSGQAVGTSWQGSLHRAYARATFANVAVRMGAEEMLWGQSPVGSLFISGNASPLPAIVVSTDTAITLPWWFRLAGPTRMTLMLADLGAKQDPPHAKLAGWQVSITPWSRFELGVAVLTQTGGSGGPKASFLERVVDLFPVIDALAPQHADLLISNKLAGGNLRLRVPEWSGLDVYYELQIDDFDARRLRSSFVDDAAHLLGARLPIVTSKGQLAVRAEWHRTSLRLYEHTQFLSGVTYRQHLIGSPLGPHAAAGYLMTSWQPAPRQTIEIVLADERRDPSQYGTVVDAPLDRGFRFIRQTDDPDYRRARALASVTRIASFGALKLTVGHNLAWRTGQERRGEWLGQLVLSSQRLAAF
jgi:hypothetical protein